ncbi:hypothetical protein SAMN04489712_103518 [Thermomonospora echinospora]|uniref:Tat pathway signal sequence domain protein n=1 Tax=Thermomonospora echinospora TaxID=1992 RepID=A0A1H5Y262_9ACTN|nr:hypothetical protein [Thermomonospora echinospora]SEG18013.1 hypothetical protein SAMN04489712_103518 [Thermomonospora echinospora]
MRRRTLRTAVVAATATAAVGLTALPSHAIPVTVSGSASSGAYTATSGTVTFTLSSGALATCSSSAGGGTMPNGYSASGNNIGGFAVTTWTGCPVTQSGTAAINVVGGTASTVQVTVTNLTLTYAVPGCTMTATGGAPGTYTNGSAVLNIDPTAPNPQNVQLVVISVTGCFGLVNPGQRLRYAGSYTLTPGTIQLTP